MAKETTPYQQRTDLKATKVYLAELKKLQSSLSEELFKAKTDKNTKLIISLEEQQEKLKRVESRVTRFGVKPVKQRGQGKVPVNTVEEKVSFLKKKGATFY